MEYNNEPMLAIAIVLEDYMGQYGIVWNSSVVEVAGREPATFGEPSISPQSFGITCQI